MSIVAACRSMAGVQFLHSIDVTLHPVNLINVTLHPVHRSLPMGASPKFNSQRLEELAAYSGDPWRPTNPYFEHAEEAMGRQWDKLIFPFIEGADFSSCLDLAAGHGRNSEVLLNYASKLAVVDFQPGNIEKCKDRLARHSNVSFYVNNGFDLRSIPDKSVTFIYCFDAMVHFDSDIVRSYLKETFRILTMGGQGFFHHSNYTGGHDWRTNPGSRNFMSKDLFAHYAIKEQLVILNQRVIDWGTPSLDCFSLIEKPSATMHE